MPGKRYGGQVPEPARFTALQGPLHVEVHDNWPDMYQLCGSVPGEDDWEWVEPENEAHMQLRSAAIQRVPQMLLELQEAYDLLLDTSDHGEIDGPGYSPERCQDDGSPERTGRRLWTLVQCIGMTLSEIERRGVELGLDKKERTKDEQTPQTGEVQQ